MLLDTIRSLFAPKPDAATAGQPATPAFDPATLAACVLLLEVAHADGEFSDVERTSLSTILERHFGLPAESGNALMEAAEQERRRTVDHFSFTQQLAREYDTARKVALAEAMWGLVLADGEISEHEHYLTRKIANLLDLAPAELSAAKARAAGG